MWVCRAGFKAMYFNQFIQEEKIYLAWKGFDIDFRTLKNMQEIRDLVRAEMESDNNTSISNWSGQLKTFYEGMHIGDSVVIPHVSSKAYTLVKITGDYSYEKDSLIGLHHSRKISLVKVGVPKNVFTQSLNYSLGAYRTIFKVKHEEEIMNVFQTWKG